MVSCTNANTEKPEKMEMAAAQQHPWSGRPVPCVGDALEELDSPLLVIDVEALRRNMAAMAAQCRARNKSWRPHAKGHKCPDIAKMQVAAGAIGITVAKLGEAEVFARHGIESILIANQVVGTQKLRRLTRLLGDCPNLQLIVAVDMLVHADKLSEACSAAGVVLNVVIEVDIGMGRGGVPPQSASAVNLATKIAALPGLRFAGLMGYEGHLLDVADPDLKKQQILDAIQLLQDTRDGIKQQAGLNSDIISASGTGSYMHALEHAALTEVEAGGCIFSDMLYEDKFQVKGFEQALTIRTTVTSRPTPTRALADAGRKTLVHWEYLPMPAVRNHPDYKVTMICAEHLVLEVPGKDGSQVAADGQTCGGPCPGDTLHVIPAYHDLTTVLHDFAVGVCDGKVTNVFILHARGRTD
eukprot:m.20540 g.20540  ORF g.20540 m.20540 type:complete len:412 (-) comp6197_c0_seq1:218-1453(-)